MIVGVDVGTQSLKAVVTDDGFQTLGHAAVAYEVDYPRPGWAQQSPRTWEDALSKSITGALAQAGRKGGDVAALGIAGQLDGCVAVDAAGAPLGDCLIWMDRRAEAEVADVPAERIRRRCGITADAGHMAAKVRWWKCHGGATAARFHQPTSYLVSRLTGEHVMDHALASTTMVYGLATRSWDDELLALFEIGPGELPALADATQVAGGLRPEAAARLGLPAGIPVAVGTGDDFSSPLGAGIVAPGTFACVLGTAEVTGALDTRPVLDPAGLVETHAYPTGGYFVENPGWLSGGAITWLAGICGLDDAAALDGLAESVPPAADGLLFLPALSGAMAPEWVAGARGCFYGLTPAHGPGHLARAVLEGCAFAMRDVLEALRRLGVGVDQIRVLGGGARSRLWAQIRADVAGLPVAVPTEVDTSPVGSAMLAAVAAGLAPDLAACARQVGHVAALIEPCADAHQAYEEAHSRYRRLFAALRPMYV